MSKKSSKTKSNSVQIPNNLGDNSSDMDIIRTEHWHGLVQLITWAFFCVICYISIQLVRRYSFEVYNVLLIDLTFLSITIAITFSHAYNYRLRPNATFLWKEGEKKRSIWLHANCCWQTVDVWMTITPLYCTCIAIYLSANNRNIDDVLIHSILSLVISMGVYFIGPANRASAYRRAYELMSKALACYELNPKKGEKMIAKAIKKGTKIIIKLEDQNRN